jgi:hypothetical protein
MVSDHDIAHIDDIIGLGYGDWWSANELRQVAKADLSNRMRMALGHPELVEAYRWWYDGRRMAWEDWRRIHNVEERERRVREQLYGG